MVPRTETVWIERTKTARQGLALALRSGFSRIPVIGENVDDVLGVLYLKDLVRRIQGQPDGQPDGQLDGQPAGRSDLTVDQIMRPAEFIPESKPVDDLLKEMQAARIHIAIVVDEYGGTAGLVTIEDILEEIVGEITDEYDVERPPVEWLSEDEVRVSARLPVEDLGELFEVELPDGEVETVAGLLAQQLGRVPIPGAGAVVTGLELIAEGTTGRRNHIDSVLVRRLAEDGGRDDERHDRQDDHGRTAHDREEQTTDA
jgi:CBS domain containing-hemolysin-like protein